MKLSLIKTKREFETIIQVQEKREVERLLTGKWWWILEGGERVRVYFYF
jgi:hypothetical protein